MNKNRGIYDLGHILENGSNPVYHKCITQEVRQMPTKNPRVNVVLEKPLYNNIERLAIRDGVSLSLKVRDLVKEALEIEEDIALSHVAETREKSFSRGKALKHDEVW